jgi:hypothetical protein
LSLLQTIGLIPSYKSSLKRFVLVQPGHPLENDSEKNNGKATPQNREPNDWSVVTLLLSVLRLNKSKEKCTRNEEA